MSSNTNRTALVTGATSGLGFEPPLPEAPKLAGLVAFLAQHDRVETTVDGEPVLMPAFEPAWISPSLHLDH